MRLLQANTFTLHKLGLIKLIYDHIFNKNYGYEKILSSLFNISRTQYWKEKSYSNPELNENQRKVVIRKVIIFSCGTFYGIKAFEMYNIENF